MWVTGKGVDSVKDLLPPAQQGSQGHSRTQLKQATLPPWSLAPLLGSQLCQGPGRRRICVRHRHPLPGATCPISTQGSRERHCPPDSVLSPPQKRHLRHLPSQDLVLSATGK